MEYFCMTIRGIRRGKPGTLKVIETERDSECVSADDRALSVVLAALMLKIKLTQPTYDGAYVDKQPVGYYWIQDEAVRPIQPAADA